MPAEKLRKYLDSENIKYVSVQHSRAYTAQEIAASAHISGKDLAKTVMVEIDGRMAMCVLPASCQTDLEQIKEVCGAQNVQLAHEYQFIELFPDCEVGAMPPFGNLYDMEVFAAKELAEDEEIAFNAGSHTELFRLAYADFQRMVHPKVMECVS